MAEDRVPAPLEFSLKRTALSFWHFSGPLSGFLSLMFQRRFILHVFCERRFFARSSFVQAQLISLNNSGASRAQDQSMQRLDLCSHKTSGGITKGQAETHRFTGVKVHGRKRAFTLENRLSRQFHGDFTLLLRTSRTAMFTPKLLCQDMLGWNRLCRI